MVKRGNLGHIFKTMDKSNIHPKKFWSYASAIETDGLNIHKFFELNSRHTDATSNENNLNDFPNAPSGDRLNSEESKFLIADQNSHDENLYKKSNKEKNESRYPSHLQEMDGAKQRLTQPPKLCSGSSEEVIYCDNLKPHYNSNVDGDESPTTEGVIEPNHTLTLSTERCNSADNDQRDDNFYNNIKRASSAESYFFQEDAITHDFRHTDQFVESKAKISSPATQADEDRHASNEHPLSGVCAESLDSKSLLNQNMLELPVNSCNICEVCGEAAHGHFFGAVVCLPCKV